MPGKKALMSSKTKSKVAKTAKEKKQWVRARQIVTKETGAKSEKSVPWGLVQKIYQDEKKSGKVAKKEDVAKTKFSKTAAKRAKASIKASSKVANKTTKAAKTRKSTARKKASSS